MAGILGGIGTIIILSSIFLAIIEFGTGLTVALVFFLLSGVFKGWIRYDWNTKTNLFNHQKAVRELMSSLAIFLIVAGIFTDWIRFEVALVVAVAIFIFSGPISRLFYAPIPKGVSSYRTSNRRDEMAEHQEFSSPGKRLCLSCGAKAAFEDIFCPECGTKLKTLHH